MDNSPVGAPLRWTTPLAIAGLAGIGVLATLALAVWGTGPARLFWSLAALGCVVLTAHVLRARPRLVVDAAGLTVRGSVHTYRWNHGQVRVGLRSTRRLGRTGTLLELDGIDTGGEERLVLLGRFDLGAEPQDVLAAIERFRAE